MSILARYTETATPREEPARQLAAIDDRCISDLFEMVNGNEEQFREMVETSADDAMKLIDAMRGAEEDGNPVVVRDAARSLKSIAAQIGAGRIHSICSTIEALANTGSMAGADALLQELSLANERAQGDLRNAKPRNERGLRDRTAAPPDPGTVLVGESDALTARFLISALANNGYKPHHVTDGNQALAQVGKQQFQVLVLDMALPGIDGLGVLSQVRLLPNYARTPIVLLSSRGADHDVLRAFELGADDHIAVPFNPLEVISRIQRLIRTR